MSRYTEYTVHVELDDSMRDVSDDTIDAVMDGLADYAPSMGASVWGRMEITVIIPARTLPTAVGTATALIAQILGDATVLRVECIQTDLGEQRRDSEDGAEISTAEAAQMLGVTPQRVHQLIHTGQLPARRLGRTWAIPAAAVHKRSA